MSSIAKNVLSFGDPNFSLPSSRDSRDEQVVLVKPRGAKLFSKVTLNDEEFD